MIDTPRGKRLAPEVERPYWRDQDGERISFQEVVAGELSDEEASEATASHTEAIRALAEAAAQARMRGEHQAARRRAFEASRLCEEIAGLWPRDSWKPMA